MSDTHASFASQAFGGADVHRRSFTKADGRMLHLYGTAPHTGEPLPENADTIARGAQMRFHPLRQEWNLYAAHRQTRTFQPAAANNPLAPSQPGKSPSEIPFDDFELAVFDNKFASLHPQAPQPPIMDGIEALPATGACEVVVYSPQDTGSLDTIGQDRRQLLIAAWIDRYAALFDAGCAYVLPFENRGAAVGTTLPHPHGQIYGFPTVPRAQAAAVEAFAGGYDLAAELAASAPDFGIAEAGGMQAWCPRFARFPYEVWIAPHSRRAALADCTSEELAGLATMLGDVTRRYDALFSEPMPLMMAVHAAPRNGTENYHLTVQFYPMMRSAGRLKYLAGIEQHTGIFTVDVMPEAAAQALRAL